MGNVCVWLLLLAAAGSAHAQIPLANDDHYGVPFDETLVVEAFGMLDNDPWTVRTQGRTAPRQSWSPT